MQHLARPTACHRFLIVEIPLQDELAVTINMYVPRGMVTSPGDEYIPTAPDL